MPPKNQSGIGGKLGPQAGANGRPGPYVSDAPVNRPKTPTTQTPKTTAPPKAQNFLQRQLSRFGGVLKTAGVAGGVQQLRDGDPMGLLTIGLSAPKATVMATGLVLADQRPAGGAIYDENGNYLPGMKEMNTLSPAQIKLKKELEAKRAQGNQKPTAELSEEPPAPLTDDEVTPDPTPETETPTPTPDPSPSPTPETETPGTGGDTTKISPTGIVQKGKSLSSANASLEALGIGPLQDAGRFVNGGQGFQIETPAPKGTKAEDVDFSSDDGIAFGMTEGEAASRAAGNTIETVITPTSTGTTGKNTSDPQEGASDKPNNADKVRAVRFNRRSAAMGFNGADFSGDEPDNSKLTSPMYANSARNAARSAFLDAPAGQGTQGPLRARDAAVGVHEDGVLLNGKFREFAPGLDQKTKAAARYSAAGGAFNTQEGLDEWTGNFLAPDSDAAPETATPQTEQEFDLSGADEKTKELVGMTQSPLLSKDIPEMSSQEDADKFLKNWRTRAGL